MSDDLFSRFNEEFQQMFKNWAKFDDEMDQFFDDFNERFQLSSEIDQLKEGKNYSISYRYDSSMEQPEITVKGDVDKHTIDKFLQGIQKRFGKQLTDINDKKIRMLTTDKTKRPPSEPFTTVKDMDGKKIYSFEMPGIGADDVVIEIDGSKVTVVGKHETIHYKKHLDVGFEPDPDIDISANNGIVSLEFEPKK